MANIEEYKSFLSNRNALLIEDNEINAIITQMQLKKAGMNVEWVLDGAQGISAYMASETNHFSVIVTDLMMPVMDGNETARQIRKSGRKDADVPIIALTANAYVNQATLGHDSNIDKCLIKPYDKMEFLDWIYTNVKKYEG